MHRPHQHQPAGKKAGFSLVELLVVIGIIALLLGLLMPALSGFRQRAREVQCQATLRNIGYAGQLHANDRRGRLPLGGWQLNPVGGVVNPVGVGDAEDVEGVLRVGGGGGELGGGAGGGGFEAEVGLVAEVGAEGVVGLAEGVALEPSF